ncbi:hypothetical protein A2Y83_00400 [Candidatus Falkowbacteria bacterium RBG_13_39_14]|uniref:DUF4012 domain-containing protein n=1 Tax=Candidatus Falkowbacteria bacterium RBG_13_39_14 TaxID=1797985 RepID=A0A1F5S8R0_9BACT|nr:MAG: hypothetical protein A2Y83_00400 [Candidatus Falkowbacteria bacterium RBG_13_39_14]
MQKKIILEKIGESKEQKKNKTVNFFISKKIELRKISEMENMEIAGLKECQGNKFEKRKNDLAPIGNSPIKQKNKKAKKQESMKKRIRRSDLSHNTPQPPARGDKKDWVILDKNAGEEFVLRNFKSEEIKGSNPTPAGVRPRWEVGMPEAGKKEPWNFIRLNENRCLETENEAAYILDDFDTLEELKKEPFNYEIKNEQYAASPYIVDLGQSQKNNTCLRPPARTGRQETRKQENKSEKSIVILLYCYIAKLLKRNKKEAKVSQESLHRPAGDQILAEEIKKPASHFIAESLSKDWKLEIKKCVKSCGDGFKKLLGEIDKLRNSFSDAFTIKRQVLATAINFSIIALLLILPIFSIRYYVKARNTKGKVLGAAYEAVSNLKLGKELLETDLPKEANIKFDEAKGGFEIAEKSLNEINNIIYNAALKVFNKDSEVESARALIKAGEKTAEISKLISEGIESRIPSESRTPLKRSTGLLDIVSQFNNTAEKVLPKLEELKNYLSLVDIETVPDEYKEEIGRAFEMAGYIEYKLADCVKYSKTIAGILAEGGSARYLLVFQNNNELRATGGFIGSYSLMDIKNGEIVNFETPEEGSYALQGGLLSNIEPPNALQLINGRWEFQDSNWWPDFPSSAKYISDIYEESGGPTVDGVIAINASFMEDLLGIIGEIEMPAYNKTITAANFMDETQKSVELEYDRKENKPKKIIAGLMPLAIEKIFDLENEKLLDAISIFNRALSKRDIQIYSADNILEAKIKNLGWGGEIKNIENRDYLAVFDTNLGGRKTDGVINQYFTHNTEVADDGAITDELIIIKKHNGIKGDYFEGVNNVDYLRIYVPLGSVLLEAEGFDSPPEDCYKELRDDAERDDYLAFVEGKEKEDIETGTIIGENFGKTYFANWTQVDPGEEITVRIKYRLPFRLFDSSTAGGEKIGKYSLYIQKQPGSREHAITKNLNLPDNLKSAWSYPGISENGKWVEFDKLESDRFYGGIFVQ